MWCTSKKNINDLVIFSYFGSSLYLVWPPLAEVIRSSQTVRLAHVSEVWGQTLVRVALPTGHCLLQQARGPTAEAKFPSIREHTGTSLLWHGSSEGLQNYLYFKIYDIQIKAYKNIFYKCQMSLDNKSKIQPTRYEILNLPTEQFFPFVSKGLFFSCLTRPPVVMPSQIKHVYSNEHAFT